MNAKLKLMVAVALFGLIGIGSIGSSAAQAGSLLNHLVATAIDCGAPAPSCGVPAPTCETPAPACCEPKITYNHICVHRVRCCGCQPPVETVLMVTNPSACNP